MTNGNLPDTTIISLTIKSPNEFIVGTNNGYSYVKGKNIDVCSTLKSNRVKDIEFGINGTLWIATDIGLIKKEGKTQTLYDKTNTNLKSNYVRCLLLNNSNLWLGTYSGLYKFDGEKFDCFNTANSELPSDTIREILIDTNGRILILTKHYLSILDKFNQILNVKAPMNCSFSRMIFENDSIFISSHYRTFVVVNDSTLICKYKNNDLIEEIDGIYYGSGKTYTFSSRKKIINTASKSTIELLTSSLVDQIDYINLIKADSSGNYYVGTSNKGLIIIKKDKKVYKVSDSLANLGHIVFPNPFKNLINYTIANDKSDFNVTLIDITGKVIYQEKIESRTDITSGKINSFLLQKGIYFLEIHLNEETHTYNLLKL